MEALLILVGTLVTLAVLATPFVAFAAFGRTNKLRAELSAISARLSILEAGRPISVVMPQAATTPVEAPPPVAEQPRVPEVAPVAAPLPAPEPIAEPATPTPPEAIESAGPAPSLEEKLGSRWAVWAGGATLALAGVFLVRYSIEQGFLGPVARVLLGMCLGFALLGAAEMLRRGRAGVDQRLLSRVGMAPANVPPTLAAAGLVALFAAIYAAYALYDLAGPLATFLALATVSAAAMALSLLHGPIVAILGQAAAFIVPALVSTNDPSALALFGYVLAVAAGCLALAKYRGWRWTAWIALAGVAGWTLLWFAGAWRPADSLVIAIFIVLTTALFAFAGPRPYGPEDRLFLRIVQSDLLPDATLVAMAVLAFLLARMGSYDVPSLLGLAGLAAAIIAASRREQSMDYLALVGAASVVAALALWHLPQVIEEALPLGMIEGSATGFVPGPIVPPSFEYFVLVVSGFAIAFGAAGFLLVAGAIRPILWATLSSAPPLLLLAIAYWRIAAFDVALPWALVALLVGAIMLGMATMVARQRSAPGMNDALGIYAVATLAAIVLALTMSLRLGWFSVALAAMIPAIGWVDRKLDIPLLRHVTFGVAAAVLVRLFLNGYVLDYPLSPTPIFNQLLYLYGLPALSFWLGLRLFGTGHDDHLADVLMAGCIACVVALVSLEIRHFAGGGRIDRTHYGLLEQSLQSIAWLIMAYGLCRREEAWNSPIITWAWQILAGAASIQIAVGQVLIKNPLWTGEDIGAWTLFNVLTLAYLVPAILAGLFRVEFARRNLVPLMRGAGAAAVVLGLIYLSLEVRRAFQGGVLSGDEPSDAEYYAYSAIWLIYGAALLGMGLRFNNAAMRYASLAVVSLTVLKVFLFDMSTLTGILRVLSFFGLGIVLLAVGWLYQRLVFPRAAAQGAST